MKKKLITGLLILGIVALFTGCEESESYKRHQKTIESEYNGGLNRIVTVYANDGKVIKTYEGKFDIEDTEAGNKVLFDSDGKRVILYNATVVVEEK